MSGNVFEWCWDWDGSYPAGPETDYTGAGSGSLRVFRGGNWDIGISYLQVGFRFDYTPFYEGGDMGFRLSRTP